MNVELLRVTQVMLPDFFGEQIALRIVFADETGVASVVMVFGLHEFQGRPPESVAALLRRAAERWLRAKEAAS